MVRRYVVLVVGIAALVVGCAMRLWPRPVTGFGWTAYAPLGHHASFALDQSAAFTRWQILDDLGLALLIVGTALTAGWIGYRLGRRRPSDAA